MKRDIGSWTLPGLLARFIVTLAALVGAAPQQAFAQAATAADWDKVIAAAKKEGKVTLYTATVVPVMQRIAADFAKVHPDITLEWFRYASGPLMAKVDQERLSNAQSADVVSSTEAGWFEDRAKENLLIRPIGPDAARFPSRYQLGAGNTAAILSMDALTIMINTNLVKTPVQTYADLLRPEFKGKIGTLDLLSTTVVAWAYWLDETYGAGTLEKLAAQQPRLYVSTAGGGQSLSSGEWAVAAYINSGAGVPVVQSGAPVRVVYVKGALAVTFVGAIVKWGRNPNAAQVLMNYMMSVRGQSIWNGNGDSASPLPNIPNSLDANSLQRIDFSKFPPERVKEMTARWNKLFK